MNANVDGLEHYLEIAQLFGKRIVKTKNCWWEEARRFGYIAAPSGLPIRVPPRDIRYMFWTGRAMAVRVFSSQPEEGDPTFYHACVDHNYNLSSLKSEARRKVLRGLENCQVRKLDKSDLSILLEEGLKINQSALTRQKRVGQDVFRDAEKWGRLLEAYKSMSEVRIYGAFFQNQLCAYLVIFQFGSKALYLHSLSATEFLRYYPNNALLFYATKDIMQNQSIDEFYVGLESLSSQNSLNEFTVNLGFQRFPIFQQLLLHPLLKPLTTRLAQSFVHESAIRLKFDYLVAINDFLQGLKSNATVSHSTLMRTKNKENDI